MSESFIVAASGRLDSVVSDRLGIPRAEVQRAIAAGRVLVNEVPRPKSFRLIGGERIEADLESGRSLLPEGPAVDVRFRDRHLIIVSKPAGLVTHPTAGRLNGTLVNRLLGMGLPLSSLGGPLRPGIVHRLDAGTSGLMLIACDDPTHEALSDLLRRHAIDRRYHALVRGLVRNAQFTVEAPLGRSGARMQVRAETGKGAETSFEVRERFAGSTLLEAAPRTGRTHQIRVHLAAIGHPIVGDNRYGGGGDQPKRLGLQRPFLHSWRIAFQHPVTGKRIEIEDPLPADLEEALRRVRGEA